MMHPNLIFILSLPRSGSTLVQKVLSGHAEIQTTAEPWLLLPLITSLYETRSVPSVYNSQLAGRAIEELRNQLDRPSFDSEIRDFTSAVYSRLTDRPEQKFFLDKTPRYYLIAEHILRIFPEAKIIVLTRNPLQIFSSVLKSWRDNKFDRFYRDYFDLYEGPTYLAKLISNNPNLFVLDYSQIVSDPVECFHSILSYLGVTPDPELVNKFKAELDLGYMGDHSNKATTVTSSSVDEWKNTFNNYFRKWLIRNYLRKLGKNDTLAVLGHDYEELSREVDKLEPAFGSSAKDFFHWSISLAVKRLKLNLIFNKLSLLRDNFIA